MEPSKQPINLEPTENEIQQILNMVAKVTNGFYSSLDKGPVFSQSPKWNGISLDSTQELGTVVGDLVNRLQNSGLQTASGGHLAYIPGGGLFIGAIADYIAAITNHFTGDRSASPIGVAIHDEVISWCKKQLGLNQEFWGDVTSGGTQATIRAMLAARQHHKIKPKDFHKTVLYCTEHSHHCFNRAANLVFAGDCQIRLIETVDYRLSAHHLEATIKSDIEKGLDPFFVMATAGTTNLGIVDDLASIATVKSRYNLWFHVDGAYGGAFAMLDSHKHIFCGLEKADSIILDPHKSMFLPYGCGIVLIAHPGLANLSATDGDTNYLQDRNQAMELSPMDYSLEVTRPFRALRIWLALKVYGFETLAIGLNTKLEDTDWIYHELTKIHKIRVITKPELTIIGFRVDNDPYGERTKTLLSSINGRGNVYLSSTNIDGKFVIRIAILSYRTKKFHLQKLLEDIKLGLKDSE